MAGEVEERVKPWRWPGMWFRDEKFWRDVGSRTLSAVFAAGIIYVFAVAGGYVAKPDFIPVIILFVVTATVFGMHRYHLRHPKMTYKQERTFLLVGIAVTVVLLVTTATDFFGLLP